MPNSGIVRDEIIESRALKKQMRLQVYLPPYYDQFSMRYPVIYLLHPWGETEHFWADTLDLTVLADRLINAGTIPPFIAAMPQGDKSFFLDAADPTDDFSRIVRLDPDYYADALSGYGQYGEHVLSTVIPYVDRYFRTRIDRAGRAIGGIGMGATGAGVLALQAPAGFGALGIHSPILFDDNRRGPPWIFGLGDDEMFARRDIIALAKQATPDVSLRIFLDCGVDDEMSERASDLHWALVERRIAHTYVSRPGGHDPVCWRNHLAEYLGFYTGGW